MNELGTTFFMGSSCGHNIKSGKSIAGLVGLVASVPVDWGAHYQLSVQTTTCRSELCGLKVVVKLAVALRHHLQCVGAPQKIYNDTLRQ